MTKILHFFLIFVCYLVGLALTQQLEIDRKIKISMSGKNNYTYLSYIRTGDLKGKGSKLAIQMQSYLPDQIYQIFIKVSKISGESVAQCKGIRHLACLIDESTLGDSEKILIKASSNNEGIYILTAKQPELQQFEDHQTEVQSKGIASYYQLILSEQKKINSIRIILKPQTNTEQSYCHMVGQFNLNSMKTYQSISMWSGAEGLFLGKLDVGKYDVLYLTVIGQPSTKYDLKYQVLNKDHHDLDIGETVQQFLEVNQQKNYHIKLQNISNQEQLAVNFMIYSGNPEIVFSLEPSITKAFKTKYYQYMADSRFTFTSQQLKGVQNLYFKARSNNHNSVFKMEVNKISHLLPELVTQNSYNFYSIRKSGSKFLYVYLNPEQNANQDNSIVVTISMTYVLGNSNLLFYIGKSQSIQCLPQCRTKQFPQFSKYSITAVALKLVYKLSIDSQNLDQSSILLMQLVNNNPQNLIEQVSIEYNFEGAIISLRENYPLTQVVQMGQNKYYRYTQLEDYKQVKICTSLISGQIGTLGSYNNPTNSESSAITPIKDCVSFTKTGIKKPMYVSVYGVSKSKYSISVQTGHSSEVVSTPMLSTNEDVNYEVTIAPLGSHVFVMHPIYSHLRILYNSSHPARICLLKNKVKLNQNQGCDPLFTREMQVSGQFYDKISSNSGSRKLQVTNPSLNENLLFRLKYHSGDYQHCQQKLLNRIYEQDVAANSCFEFQLDPIQKDSNADYQVIIKQLIQFPQNVAIGVCGKQIMKSKNDRIFTLPSHAIISNCQNVTEPTVQLIVQVEAYVAASFKFQYILQQIGQISRLPINVKFGDTVVVGEAGPLRQYVVNPSLQTDLIVKIKQHSSFVLIKASAFVSNKLVSLNPATYKILTPLATSKMQDDLQITMAFTAVQIKNQCQKLNGNGFKSMQCDILMVIQPQSRDHVGRQTSYTIQFKSPYRQLKQHQPQQQLLSQQGQFVIFNYYPVVDQSSLGPFSAGIKISTQNEQCATLYLNRYFQPNRNQALIVSNDSFNVFSIDTNIYLIQVQANGPNCHFTIQIYGIKGKNGAKNIEVLHQEMQTDIRMKNQEVTYFLVDAGNSQHWKVLYLRKFGDIRLYVTNFTDENEKKILNNKSYNFIETDFPYGQQFPNILNLPGYKNQLMIVAIKAQSHTQGSLILHHNEAPLTVPHSKKLLNILNGTQQVVLRFYSPKKQLKKGEIKIDLLYGAVKVNTSFVFQSEQRIKENLIQSMRTLCCGNDIKNVIPFNFYQGQGGQFPSYLTVKLEQLQGLSDLSIIQVSVQIASYEVAVSDIDKDALTHLQLTKQHMTIIKTASIYKQYKVIISATDQANGNKSMIFKYNLPEQKGQKTQVRAQLQSLNGTQQKQQINGLLDCLEVQVCEKNQDKFVIKSRSVVLNNVLSVTAERLNYKQGQKQRSKLLLQIKIKDQCPVDQITVSVTPSIDDRLSILSPFKWAYLQKQRDFAVVTKKNFLVDIVSCSGPVQLNLAKSYSQLSKQLQRFDKKSMLPNQPHVFKVSPVESVTYLKLKSEEATIRYIQVDEEKQSGVGYLKYEWDYFLYETDFQKLTIYLRPLKNITQTKTKLGSAIYLLRIIQGLDTRKASSQCVNVGQNTIYSKFITSQTHSQQKILISKQQLLKELEGKPDNLYISIDMTTQIITPEGSTQFYKFLSPVQEIPVDIFNITRLSNKMIGFGILSILAVIFGCGLLAQCFLKYVVPILGRFKGTNQLVEQDQSPASQQMQNLPASSDRNRRTTTQLQQQKSSKQQSQQRQRQQQQQAPSTEQKMNS